MLNIRRIYAHLVVAIIGSLTIAVSLLIQPASAQFCAGEANPQQPARLFGPFPGGERRLSFGGRGGCVGNIIAGGAVYVILERSSWSGWREVATVEGHYYNNKISLSGHARCLSGTYDYRTTVSFTYPTIRSGPQQYSNSSKPVRFSC